MSEPVSQTSPSVLAVLNEISQALQRLLDTGEPWTLFIDKMALTPEERQEIRDILGDGGVSIRFSNTAEPAQWLESGVSGVWYGVFLDQSQNPLLETIEICFYPGLAAAQREDVLLSREKLQGYLAETISQN